MDGIFEPINVNEVEGSSLDFNKIEKESFVDVSEVIGVPPAALSIGYQEKDGKKYPIPFGSFGDFSCIVGASKSKKTFFKSLLISRYIGGESDRNGGIIKTHITDKKRRIIDFDTEQGKWHVQRSSRRIIDLVGHNYDYYTPFSLRKYSHTERMLFIEHIIYKYKNDLGLVVIDQIADLVSNVNDLTECNEIGQKFMKWSEELDCHIITVIHKNFGSSKPTGHLGSAVLKKSETVAMLNVDENDKMVTNVEFEYTRGYQIEPFKISVDNNWMPYILDDEERLENNFY